MNVITKAERARLEWLAKHVVSSYLSVACWGQSVYEELYQQERENKTRRCANIVRQRERGLLTEEEAVHCLCREID